MVITVKKKIPLTEEEQLIPKSSSSSLLVRHNFIKFIKSYLKKRLTQTVVELKHLFLECIYCIQPISDCLKQRVWFESTVIRRDTCQSTKHIPKPYFFLILHISLKIASKSATKKNIKGSSYWDSNFLSGEKISTLYFQQRRWRIFHLTSIQFSWSQHLAAIRRSAAAVVTWLRQPNQKLFFFHSILNFQADSHCCNLPVTR